MPTASNKDSTTKANSEVQDPQKLVQNLVEKKIRNLEKRKTRLQELRDQSAKGQELEPEQELAIKKLDQVVEMIDLMKDLNKSLTEVLSENNKQQKKLAKKELLDKQLERQQQELDRLKTIIQFQDILARFEVTVRQDFSKGTNGAIKLSEEQLSNLDKLYAITSETSDDKIESTAEKLIALADGKSREAWPGVTFQQLKELLSSIVDTKYFSHDSTPSTTTSTTTTATTNVLSSKGNESAKKFPKENESLNNSKSNSSQFPSMANTDIMGLNQMQSQFAANTGISFMRDSLVDKDPAVVAVASVPNYSYHYGIQTNDSLISNSIPDSTTPSINTQKNTTYENSSSMSTIPTQTFTNQQFAALIPGNAYVSVPVTLAAVQGIPMTGLVQQDLTGHPLSTDLTGGQTYSNQQNFMNSNADKHQTTSQERVGPNFTNDDTYRNNNRMRTNRMDNSKIHQKSVNGSGGRPRNPNKAYPNQMPSFAGYPKYDNNINGSSFAANTFEKGPNNNFAANRSRQQVNRGNRTENRNNRNANYTPNFNTTGTVAK